MYCFYDVMRNLVSLLSFSSTKCSFGHHSFSTNIYEWLNSSTFRSKLHAYIPKDRPLYIELLDPSIRTTLTTANYPYSDSSIASLIAAIMKREGFANVHIIMGVFSIKKWVQLNRRWIATITWVSCILYLVFTTLYLRYTWHFTTRSFSELHNRYESIQKWHTQELIKYQSKVTLSHKKIISEWKKMAHTWTFIYSLNFQKNNWTGNVLIPKSSFNQFETFSRSHFDIQKLTILSFSSRSKTARIAFSMDRRPS